MMRADKTLPLVTVAILVVLALSVGSLTTPHQDSYVEVAGVAQEFANSHTYILNVYDCDDMSITLANKYHSLGYNTTLMLGNPYLNISRMQDINHAWVMVQVHNQWLAVESETGQIIRGDSHYYNGWPVRVEDYWAWWLVHMNLENILPMPEQFYPVPI